MAAPAYVNGFAPENLMVSAGYGYDKYGRYDWLMTPGQYAKHLTLLRICKERTGHVPDLTAGYSAYRPYRMQELYRNDLGIGAAKPGTSSHGGKWAGPITNWNTVPTMAMDYHNWYLVFNNDRNAWYQAVRDAGLVPGQITKASFGADEPWHVIDLDPWRNVTASGGSTPFPSQENDMFDQAAVDHLNKLADVIIARVTDTTQAQANGVAGYVERIPAQTWAYGLKHAITGATTQAGDLLASEPLEHFNTRVEVDKVSTEPLSQEQIEALATVIATKVAEKLPEGDVVDAEVIAKAVRAEFKTNPLT